jgi:DNA-binding MarR family transcriptional regulator
VAQKISADPASADTAPEAFGLLLEVHADLTRRLGRELEQATGIPLSWYEVLIRLARGPAEGIRLSKLADSLVLSTSGATRLADRMEAAGLIERAACATDRRGALAVLTDAGREALARTTPVHVAGVTAELGARLDADERAQLTVLLRKLRGGDAPACTE